MGLRGIGPALAGNVGTGGAFARLREGDQDVDVPMLAPDLSRCRPGVLSGSIGSILGGDLRREMMDCVVGGGEFKEGQAPRLAGRASGGKGGVGGASAEPFTG